MTAMLNNLNFRLLTVTLILSSSHLAIGNEKSLDCISTAPTTIHLMGCYAELSNQEDAKLKVKLNNIYQDYPGLASKIKESYQHWLTYRESHCSLVYDAWGDGSARQYAYSKCLYEMARDWDNPMYVNYR